MSRFKFFGSYVAFLSFMGGWIAGVPASAQAGQETHGGHAVVCKATDGSGGGTSIDILDHFEGQVSIGAPLSMGEAASEYRQVVKFVLDRLASIDPLAAARFQKRADRFESEMVLLDESRMKTIGDSNEVLNPGSNCYKTQFVVQITNPRQFEKRYLVNQQLWETADAYAKAGIVLHEVIFTDAVVTFDQKTSDATRYYNYVISSQLMESMTADEYISLVRECGFILSREFLPEQQLFSVVRDGVPVHLEHFKTDIWSDAEVGTVVKLGTPVNYRLASGRMLMLRRSEVLFIDGRVFRATLDESVWLGDRDFSAEIVGGIMVRSGAEIYLQDRVVTGVMNRYVTNHLSRVTTVGGDLVTLATEDCGSPLRFRDGKMWVGCLALGSKIQVKGTVLSVRGMISYQRNGLPDTIENVDGGVVLGDLELPALVSRRGLFKTIRYSVTYSLKFDENGKAEITDTRKERIQ